MKTRYHAHRLKWKHAGCAVRDDRRSGQLVNGTNKKHMVSYTVDLTENSPVSPSHA